MANVLIRPSMFLNEDSQQRAIRFFREIVDLGVDFKINAKVREKPMDADAIDRIIGPLPDDGQELEGLLAEFREHVLPYCTNFSSRNFMGFPDAGNSIAGIGGALVADMLQQNLINQSFCAPSATYVEIAVLQWLRDIVGYQNTKPENVWDVGGIIMPGGTGSNAVAMMLARESRMPGTMAAGMTDPRKCAIVVPKGIGHYSVKSAQMWIGCGNNLLEVETDNFKYDLADLKRTLAAHKKDIMCVVAYAGDSRTMTVDRFTDIHDIVKSHDESIWLHADACHGFSLGLSDTLKHKIEGMNLFDSITVDPHKVMNVPYTLSALLVKEPGAFKKVTSMSDLIMQEQFAFGQITPFVGSKPWQSLKLWFMMKNIGRKRLGELIERRHEIAKYLEKKLRADPDFVVIHEVQINAVAFLFMGSLPRGDIASINAVSRAIHATLAEEGDFHLHQFSIPDAGIVKKGDVIYPLRFMSGNPNIRLEDVDAMVERVRALGKTLTPRP